MSDDQYFKDRFYQRLGAQIILGCIAGAFALGFLLGRYA